MKLDLGGHGSERYQREIEALEALHDPRICTGGVTAEGESLASCLARASLPPGDALALAIELASALEAPHRLGILHRNLTPANIWLLPNGQIRLLHFNAARALAATAGGSPREVTFTNEPLDPRSDIRSFGSVLKAISGGHPTPTLRRITRRCLDHNPDFRFQSATDLREALERLVATSESRRELPWRSLAFIAIALLIGGVTWWKLATMPPASLPVPTFNFSQATFTADITAAAISPDGRYVATVHSTRSGNSLRLLALAQGREAPLLPPSFSCCADPSIAPDDSTVYFLAAGALQAVPLHGGPPHTVAPSAISGAALAPSGEQITYIGSNGLMLAGTDGSDDRVLAPGAFDAVTPAWSPDGQSIAAATGGKLQIVSASTGQLTALPGAAFSVVSGLAWLPSGRGLLVTASTAAHAAQQVWQVPWPTGQPAVVTNDESGYSGLTASQSGMLSLLRSAPQASLWVERSAANSFTELPGGDLTREGADGLAWLRDGRILASHVFHHDYQLWAVTPDGLHARPLPLKGPVGALLAPVATPSGSIVFLARSGGRISLWRANPDGSGSTRLTVALATGAGLGLIDNGTQVELIVAHQLWSVPVAGGDAHQLWNEPIRGLTSAASPGGRRILVFLPDPTILTLAPSGAMTTSPVALNRQTMFPPYAWTPDGRAITFIHRHGSVANVWALPVAGGPPHPLTHFTDLDIFAYTFGPHGRIALSRGRENTNLYFAHATKK